MREWWNVPFKGINIDENEVMWAWDNKHKVITSINTKSFMAQPESPFFESYNKYSWDYGDVLKVNGQIVAAPMDVDEILLIDAVSKQTVSLDISFISDKYPKYKFIKILKYLHYAILIGCFCPYIVMVDTINKRIDRWLKIEKIKPDEAGAYFRNARLIGNTLYVLPCADNKVPAIELPGFFCRIHELNLKAIFGFGDIVKHGDNYWLISRRAEIITCWNQKNGTVKSYPENEVYTEEMELGYLILGQNEILVFPLLGSKVKRFNLLQKQWENDEVINRMVESRQKKKDYLFTGFVENNCYAYLAYDYMHVLLSYNKLNGEIKEYEVIYSPEGYGKYIKKKLLSGEVLEEAECPLSIYLDLI